MFSSVVLLITMFHIVTCIKHTIICAVYRMSSKTLLIVMPIQLDRQLSVTMHTRSACAYISEHFSRRHHPPRGALRIPCI